MSFYGLIAGVGMIAVGHILTAISTLIVAVKGNQSEDKTEKGALRAAAGFLGVSILFGTLMVILGLILASTKGCSKKNKIGFIIVTIIFAICYIIALVIIYIYMKRREKAGDTGGARDLRASFVQPLVALALYVVGGVILFIIIGSKVRKLAKVCKQAKQVTGKQF
jgi:Na+/melibiose symporter-like transporter